MWPQGAVILDGVRDRKRSEELDQSSSMRLVITIELQITGNVPKRSIVHRESSVNQCSKHRAKADRQS